MNVLRVLANLFAAVRQWGWYRCGNLRAGLKGVRVGPGACVSPRARLDGVYSVGSATIGSDVVMGEGSYIGSGQLMSARIGRWCSIGYEVVVGPSEHDPGAATTSPVLARARGLPASATERALPPPVIEDEVWIGARVVVLRGTRIGQGAVVAAGAVVTRDIPPMEIWGGVPARLLQRRRP
jgi:maltose O-acetyltransferase